MFFFGRHLALRLEIDLERLHDPHTMSKSTDIRTLRVQSLFGLGAAPSFFTCFIIQMRCNETDKFDCKLVEFEGNLDKTRRKMNGPSRWTTCL